MASPSANPANGSRGVLLLTEEDVHRLLTIDLALEAVEQGLRKLALDEAMNTPRARVQTDHAMLHIMSAAAKSLGYMGAKIYSTSRKSGARFLLPLFDGKTGALVCLMQADYLGQMRTGAASGVATKYMALPDATEVGVYGSGKQARTQVQAVCRVRRVRQVQVYSPNEVNRRTFAAEMSELCQTEVVPVPRPEMAAEKKDIIITATTSREPVLNGHWISQARTSTPSARITWARRSWTPRPCAAVPSWSWTARTRPASRRAIFSNRSKTARCAGRTFASWVRLSSAATPPAAIRKM